MAAEKLQEKQLKNTVFVCSDSKMVWSAEYENHIQIEKMYKKWHKHFNHSGTLTDSLIVMQLLDTNLRKATRKLVMCP